MVSVVQLFRSRVLRSRVSPLVSITSKLLKAKLGGCGVDDPPRVSTIEMVALVAGPMVVIWVGLAEV